MKNKEYILKYISGLLSESDMKEFEQNLENNSVLKNEFENYKKSISNLSNIDYKVNDAYFNNLTVNFRQKLEKKRKTRRVSFASSFGLVTAIILFFIFPHINNSSFSEKISFLQDDFAELSQTNQNNLSDYISDYQIYNYDLNEEMYLDDAIKSIDENVAVEYVQQNNLTEVVEEQLKNLSDNDFNDFLSELNEVKFL